MMIDKETLTAHIQDIEQRQQIKKIIDLCEQSICSHSVRHTKFLTPNQIVLAQNVLRQIHDANYKNFSPTSTAERQLIYFFSEYVDFEEVELDIAIVKLSLANDSDSIGHRDILGSIMSLGIERENIGDILFEGKDIFVILLKPFDSYLLTDLRKVRNTKVTVELCDKIPETEAKFEEVIINVASLRLDAVISSLLHLSRDKSQKLIQRGDVKMNYEEQKENSKQLVSGDIVSVRKFGKFRIGELISETKKNRFRLQIFRYTN